MRCMVPQPFTTRGNRSYPNFLAVICDPRVQDPDRCSVNLWWKDSGDVRRRTMVCDRGQWGTTTVDRGLVMHSVDRDVVRERVVGTEIYV
jgi:hypothetical protein